MPTQLGGLAHPDINCEEGDTQRINLS